jgi:hypothetical protein
MFDYQLPTRRTMAPFRVTQEFVSPGDPPTQATADRVRARLQADAPDADPRLEIGIGRIQLVLTVEAEDAAGAVARATALAGAVLGRRASQITVGAATPA